MGLGPRSGLAIDEWLDPVAAKFPIYAFMRELERALVVAAVMRGLQRPGGLFTAHRHARSFALIYWYVTARPNYSRLAVEAEIMERTIPDDHLVALIILSYVDMGTHCLSFDHFIEEIHRLYGIEVPKDHLNKDSWLRSGCSSRCFLSQNICSAGRTPPMRNFSMSLRLPTDMK